MGRQTWVRPVSQKRARAGPPLATAPVYDRIGAAERPVIIIKCEIFHKWAPAPGWLIGSASPQGVVRTGVADWWKPLALG